MLASVRGTPRAWYILLTAVSNSPSPRTAGKRRPDGSPTNSEGRSALCYLGFIMRRWAMTAASPRPVLLFTGRHRSNWNSLWVVWTYACKRHGALPICDHEISAQVICKNKSGHVRAGMSAKCPKTDHAPSVLFDDLVCASRAPGNLVPGFFLG